MNEQQRRDLLARFGVTGDTALQPVASLSGGERCRAALARLAAADANFLVLDEPTNHLDLWARDALEQALADFDGTVLFVSHDRYFVNRLADHLMILDDGRLQVIEGNYEAYRLQTGRQAAAAEEAAPPPAKPARPAGQDAKKSSRPKRRFPYRKLADLEDEIFGRETCIERLQQELAQGETHRDGQRSCQINAENCPAPGDAGNALRALGRGYGVELVTSTPLSLLGEGQGVRAYLAPPLRTGGG